LRIHVLYPDLAFPFTMTRTSSLALIAIAVVLLLVAFLAIQPPSSARVVRHGRDVDVYKHRIAWRTPFGGRSCFVPLEGTHLYFKKTLSVPAKSGESFDVPLSFLYEAPAKVPADWPDGDWCTSLDAWLRRRLTVVMTDISSDSVMADPRKTGEQISTALKRELRAVSIQASVAARVDLPAGWERTRPVHDITSLARQANPVIFVGLDGGDWQLLDDYVARGLMPNLGHLVREGASGVLTTEHPPLSAILWTTMMTGVSPLEHQVLDFTHFNPATGNKEPITSTERRAPAIWNMETMAGKSVAVFGLWATYPAEPVLGLLASDRLFTFLYSEASPPPNSVYPPSREPWARARMAAAEKAVNFDVMQQYLPWLIAADYESLVHEPDPYSKPPSALRRILVETEIYRRLSLDLLSGSVPDLTIIYIQGTDIVGHVFAPYAPPKQREISESDYEKYHQVPEKYFQSIDRFLGEVIRIADAAHATIFIASDHGFHWKEDRPINISSVANATAAKWHRNEGIYVLRGAGIRASRGHSGHGTIRQVCPTLLAVSGLPSGVGIAGPPLSPLEARKATADYRRYFQPFAPPDTAAASSGANEALAKLRALGYIGAGESSAAPPTIAGRSTKTAGAYNNEGLILKHEGRTAEAIASFERAMTIDPKVSSAPWNLSDLLFERKENLQRSDALLIRAIANGLPEAPRYAIERGIYYQRSGHLDRSAKLLQDAVEARPDDSDLRMFRGRYRVAQNDCRGALEDFVTVQQMRPNDAVAWASAGLAEICLGNRAEADAYIRHSLELDPNQPKLRQFLGR
jgi:Flp pilus assembly protein TadD